MSDPTEQKPEHWDRVYRTKASDQVSWYAPHLEPSRRLIAETGVRRVDPIIDVGGGASTLVDDLVADGYSALTVLDISPTALQLAQRRLGLLASRVQWIEADVTQADLPPDAFQVWHDRAVFHFLTDAQDRQRYVDTVRRAVKRTGHVIVATFGPEGPLRCSGLDVVRYTPEALHGEFGSAFSLVEHVEERHQTPFGTIQQFVYCYCRLK
jgi:SAM-dependent methyltransferase